MTELLQDDEAPVRSTKRKRWLLLTGVLVAVAGLVTFVLVYFQPQKLIFDDKVDEPIPTVAAGSLAPPSTTASTSAAGPATSPPAPDPTVPPTPAPSAQPLAVARGEFISLDHGTKGVALVLELSDGRRVVRLEGLDTSNGPHLFVYLTASPAGGPEKTFDDDYLNLGRLKGNVGNQNYDLPADADLAHHGTVLIWCDRFNSAFGAADLTAP